MYFQATVHAIGTDSARSLDDFLPQDEAVYSRLLSPVETTYVDIEKIGYSFAIIMHRQVLKAHFSWSEGLAVLK